MCVYVRWGGVKSGKYWNEVLLVIYQIKTLRKHIYVHVLILWAFPELSLNNCLVYTFLFWFAHRVFAQFSVQIGFQVCSVFDLCSLSLLSVQSSSFFHSFLTFFLYLFLPTYYPTYYFYNLNLFSVITV